MPEIGPENLIFRLCCFLTVEMNFVSIKKAQDLCPGLV